MDFVWYIVFAILVIAVIITVAIIIVKRREAKRKNDIISLFQAANEKQNITEYKIEYVKKEAYDFYYEDSNKVIYVKIVNNPLNKEICINNAIKWQLRTHGGTDEMVFVEGIEGLMRMDLPKDKRSQHKLYIVYPSARALLKVINECEMVFIYPHTDVYGTNVISYVALRDNPELVKLK